MSKAISTANSPCAACKFLRRKCTQGCIFAPYFPPENPARFAQVHRVFGASNVAKLLNDLAPSQREDAVNSLAYEAEARLHDPVLGCVGYISFLQHRLLRLQRDLSAAKRELASCVSRGAALGPFLLNNQLQVFRDQQEEYEMMEAAAREEEMMRSVEREGGYDGNFAVEQQGGVGNYFHCCDFQRRGGVGPSC